MIPGTTGVKSMTDQELSAAWAEHRSAVFGAAYRILGSVADAEDIEQGT